MIKYRRLPDPKQQRFILSWLWRPKPKIKVRAGLRPVFPLLVRPTVRGALGCVPRSCCLRPGTSCPLGAMPSVAFSSLCVPVSDESLPGTPDLVPSSHPAPGLVWPHLNTAAKTLCPEKVSLSPCGVGALLYLTGEHRATRNRCEKLLKQPPV